MSCYCSSECLEISFGEFQNMLCFAYVYRWKEKFCVYVLGVFCPSVVPCFQCEISDQFPRGSLGFVYVVIYVCFACPFFGRFVSFFVPFYPYVCFDPYNSFLIISCNMSNKVEACSTVLDLISGFANACRAACESVSIFTY